MYMSMRHALSTEACESKSRQISNHFFSFVNLSNIKTLHTFLPIVSKKEVNTWPIIERLQKDFPLLKISIPKIENDSMINYYFEDKHQLKLSSWGIEEPISGEIASTEKIDLVLVPLLSFDNQGNRVGYGKGFYDRFLKACRSDCKKVGLSFFEANREPISSDAYDIKVDFVITPLGKKDFVIA